MTPERYRQINMLLDGALERAPVERAAFLAEACGGDDELRREAELLLAACVEAGTFIERPPDQLAFELMDESDECLPEPMTGRTLGRYRLGALLGAGGMGQVYRATDTRLRREVAVKILPDHLMNDPEALHRFEREARAVAALSHPNILAIHDFDTEQGVSYAVMELLEGETLRERLKRLPLDWRKAVEIGTAIAEGLAAAHAKEIIHRDLKPENIFLTSSGGLKILDFGIARMKESVTADSETLNSLDTTKPGAIMGTIGYMSPEQVRGEEADVPSDVFSLGCVLYEMVSGRRPFAHATAAETIAAILKEDPPALAEARLDIPVGLEQLIRGCLEKQPSARLQSARDLADGLMAISGGQKTLKVLLPRSRSRRRVALIFCAAVALLLGVGAWLIWARRNQAIDSLAVLPLVNASKDADAEDLSDGITESLINSLSRLPQLKLVIAHSTMASYKGRQVDPRKVGQELNVRAVLAGKMSQQGDTLIIKAELVNVSDGALLWGDQYSKKQADIMEVQVEIAKQIYEKLRLAITSQERQRLSKRPTENAEAYRLYLNGRHYSNEWKFEGFKKGIDNLNQAINLDPTYALAYAGLAQCYYDASGPFFHPSVAMPQAREAALQALKLDPDLGEAHTTLALIKSQYEWEWEEAEKEFKRAIELSPGYAPAHQWYGYSLAEQGRMTDAISKMARAHELDPLSAQISTVLAWLYYLSRQYDEAIARFQKIIEMNSTYNPTHYSLGFAYEQKGMLVEAIAELKQARLSDSDNPYHMGMLGHAYAVAGKRDEAQKLVDELKEKSKKGNVDPFYLAIIYVGLREKDQAFAWMEKAAEFKSEELLMLKVDPRLDDLRSDSRFTALLRRLNLTQ